MPTAPYLFASLLTLHHIGQLDNFGVRLLTTLPLATRVMKLPQHELLSSGQVSDRPETLDRKVSKGCESTGFEETCRSGERRGQETLAEHGFRNTN